MSQEEGKSKGLWGDQQEGQQQSYGTFHGVPGGHSQPAMGFPQPVPPPGLTASAPPAYYAQGYQAVPGYVPVAEGRPLLREQRLPCCGIGMGWLLFILGFLLGAVPWYVGAFILLFLRVDYREKPGFVACTVGAAIATIAIIFGASKGFDFDDW